MPSTTASSLSILLAYYTERVRVELGEWTRLVLVVGRAVRATARLMYCAIGGCGTCDGTIDRTNRSVFPMNPSRHSRNAMPLGFLFISFAVGYVLAAPVPYRPTGRSRVPSLRRGARPLRAPHRLFSPLGSTVRAYSKTADRTLTRTSTVTDKHNLFLLTATQS